MLSRRHLAASLLCLSATTAAAQGPDLPALFADPRPQELHDVRADWALRRNEPKGWRIDAQGMVAGHETRVVSHLVDGNRHYGLVRFPLHFKVGGTFPVLVYLHGGAVGVGISNLTEFDSVLSVMDLPNEFVYVAPSFRSELVDAGPLGLFHSEGKPSRLDHDVDDAMALLSVVLQTIPEADRLRVGVFGSSRGGGVALLMGARDERVRRLADSAGIADLFLPEIESAVMFQLASPQALNDPVLRFVMTSAVEPYLAGKLTLGEARRVLLRSSPAWFTDDLPDLQLHHGELDDVVAIAHSDQVAHLMTTRTNAPCEYWRYPLGEHTLSTMDGAGRRLNAHFGRLIDAPASYCREVARDGPRIECLGEPVITIDDFTLAVTGAPESVKGVFLMSPGAAYTPVYNGLLCLAPPIKRVASVHTGADGSASARIDLHAFAPGSTWYFQFAGRAKLRALSDALRVTFVP